jgi:hypothetical protein
MEARRQKLNGGDGPMALCGDITTNSAMHVDQRDEQINGEGEKKKAGKGSGLQTFKHVPRSHTDAVLGDGGAVSSGMKRGLDELAGMEVDDMYQEKKNKLEAFENE